MSKITPLLLIALLAGCVEMSRAEKLAHWSSRCDEYGFIRGTDAFAACIQSEARNRARPPTWEPPPICRTMHTVTGPITTCN